MCSLERAGCEQASPPSLSVLFPAYNDSGTIASLVITALQSAAKLTPDYEVIVVNDGSSDATAEIAEELARGEDLAALKRAADEFGGRTQQLADDVIGAAIKAELQRAAGTLKG